MSTEMEMALNAQAQAEANAQMATRPLEKPFVLEYEIVDDVVEDPVFRVIGEKIEVTSATDECLECLKSQLEQTGLPVDKSEGFIKQLAKSFGGRYAEIFGFRPVPLGEGDTDISSIDLLFGRVHMPAVSGFVTKISIEQEQEKKADINIKVNGFGAGGSKTYSCKVSQSQAVSAIPIDLVIPASIKIVRFENLEGEYFYICYPINISRKVVPRRTMNQFDSEDGYVELVKLHGIVDRYDTTVLTEPLTTSESLEKSTKIVLTADIGKLLNMPAAIKISGVATVKSKMKVSYTLPTGYEFASYVQSEGDFSHIWAKK